MSAGLLLQTQGQTLTIAPLVTTQGTTATVYTDQACTQTASMPLTTSIDTTLYVKSNGVYVVAVSDAGGGLVFLATLELNDNGVQAVAPKTTSAIQEHNDQTAALSIWTNAKTFGVLGDDLTDDTANLQRALSQTGDGGVVYASGKIRTTVPLVLPRGVRLVMPQAPRWSYTFAPLNYIKPRSFFAGAAVIMLQDKEQLGASVEQGGQRLENVTIDGSAVTGGTIVDGILATGLVRDVRLENVCVRNMTGKSIRTDVYVRLDTNSYYPRGWQLSHVVADTGNDVGFWHKNLDDSIHEDCLAVGNNGDGFFLSGMGESHGVGNRAVFNKGRGFHITGNTFGSMVWSNTTTDRNEMDGVLVDVSGGKLPIILNGVGLRRDGRNGNVGGGSFSGMYISGATCPVLVNGIVIMPGVDDDATGTNSPQIGLRLGANYRTVITGGYLHGATTSFTDDSNNSFYRLVGVVKASGSTAAPTLNLGALPGSGQVKPLRTVTASTTARFDDEIIVLNGTTLTGTLPLPASYEVGKPVTFININASAATVSPAGGTISGAASVSLAQWARNTFVTDGTNWLTIA